MVLISGQALAKGPHCSSLFENSDVVTRRVQKEPQFVNGHNESLRVVMIRMRDFENQIREFVEGLNVRGESKYLSAKDYRNFEALEKTIDIVAKYEKILNHLVLHAKDMMMTARIEMIPVEKRAEFLEGYKQSYLEYLEGVSLLRLELEAYRNINPSQWNNQRAKDILMSLHTQMGASHNKF